AHDSSDAQLAELSDLNFTRLKHLGATEDEALYGIFQEVPVVLLEGTDLDNSSQELQSNQWCRRRLDGCGHKAVAAHLKDKLPPTFKNSGVICVGFGRGVWLMSTYATMFPQNCGFIVWVGSPNEVFDVTFGIWVLSIHPYTDLAACSCIGYMPSAAWSLVSSDGPGGMNAATVHDCQTDAWWYLPFGGSKLWKFNVVNETWTEEEKGHRDGSPPSVSSNGQGCVAPDGQGKRVWIYGGFNFEGGYNQDGELWHFTQETSSWFQADDGSAREAVCSGSGDIDRGDIFWQFGGRFSNGRWSNAMWSLDTNAALWTEVDSGSSAGSPTERRYLTGHLDGLGRFWIFAGEGGNADLWSFDTVLGGWTLHDSGSGPDQRQGHSSFVDAAGRFYVYSGAFAPAELWRYQPSILGETSASKVSVITAVGELDEPSLELSVDGHNISMQLLLPTLPLPSSLVGGENLTWRMDISLASENLDGFLGIFAVSEALLETARMWVIPLRMAFATQPSSLPEDMFVLKHWNGKCVRAESGSTNPGNDDRLVFSDSCNTSAALLFKKVYFQSGSDYFNLQLQNGRCIHPLGGSASMNNQLVFWDWCGKDSNDDKTMFTLVAEGADFVWKHRETGNMCVHPYLGTPPVDGQYLVLFPDCRPSTKLFFTEVNPLTASTTSVSSDRRQQVPCDADALCYSSEMIKWTGPDITDASRNAMAACVGAKPDAMINLNTGMI
ncbi:rngB, partial [Symbiodinium microadriaticum]